MINRCSLGRTLCLLLRTELQQLAGDIEVPASLGRTLFCEFGNLGQLIAIGRVIVLVGTNRTGDAVGLRPSNGRAVGFSQGL